MNKFFDLCQNVGKKIIIYILYKAITPYFIFRFSDHFLKNWLSGHTIGVISWKWRLKLFFFLFHLFDHFFGSRRHHYIIYFTLYFILYYYLHYLRQMGLDTPELFDIIFFEKKYHIISKTLIIWVRRYRKTSC